MLYFSPATGGFYDRRFNIEVPFDAVKINEEERDAAIAALKPGHKIAAGPDGKPVVVPATPDLDSVLSLIRHRRAKLLRDSDYTQAPDYPIGDAMRAEWAAYRQALRDLPAAIDTIDQVVWPTPPAQ